MAKLVRFYSHLYQSKAQYTPDSLCNYLQSIILLKPSNPQRALLNSLIALEEIQEATSSFPSCKALQDDGLPLEIYKQYADLILPDLLKLNNKAFTQQCLLASMTRANIILLWKPSNPLQILTIRPILLLQTDNNECVFISAYLLHSDTYFHSTSETLI